ncbi:MAG: fatty acid desaturase [Planctomycetota bacterium]
MTSDTLRIPTAPAPKPSGSPTDAAETFSMREARSLLADEDLRPSAGRYWTDMLLSWAGMVVTIKLVQIAALGWPLRIAAFAASVLLIYRSALFIHELSHLPEREFTRFRFAWNLLCGVPFLIPTFVYQTHLDHHRRRHYGTTHDGEYLPFGSRPVLHLLAYLGQSFVIPLLAVIRFGVLTPLTWFGGPARDWVYRHASSMIIDPSYVRPLPSEKQLRSIRWQEAACFGWLVLSATLVTISLIRQGGVLSPYLVPQLYATAVCVIFLNAVRTLGAHRYYYDPHASGDEPMSFTEQLLDSINYPHRPWIGVLWAPVGLRYHALHHLFPTLPYHAMDRVHAKLMAGLPADSPYRRTESPGLWAALADLWSRARTNGRSAAEARAAASARAAA